MLFAIIGGIIIGAILGSYLAYRSDKKEAVLKAATDPVLMITGIHNVIESEMTYVGWLKKLFNK